MSVELQTECFHSLFTIFFEIFPHPERYFRPEWRSSCRRAEKSAKKTHRMNNGWWKTFLCYRASFFHCQATGRRRRRRREFYANEEFNKRKFGNVFKDSGANATCLLSVYSYFVLEEFLECSLSKLVRDETRGRWLVSSVVEDEIQPLLGCKRTVGNDMPSIS